MWIRLSVALALGLITSACAGPEAVWEGQYRGTYECAGTYRDSGDPYSEGPSASLVTVERDASTGAPFITGQCPIWLTVRSEEYANPFTSGVCMVVTPDGVPVTFEVTGGTAELRAGSRFTYDISVALGIDGDPVDVNCGFAGDRVL